MERLDLSPEEMLTTTRTVRRRLDLTRAVEREVVEACLRLAFQAPNGGDQQTWGWVVVDDPATKALFEFLKVEPSTPPAVAAVSERVRKFVAAKEVAGAVTLVATPDRVIHLAAAGSASLDPAVAMRADDIFWIASMSKPVLATLLLMLQDEGLLSVDDPVEKYLPEFKGLKTADGKPAEVIASPIVQEACLAEHAAAAGGDVPSQRQRHEPLRTDGSRRHRRSTGGRDQYRVLPGRSR